MVELDEKVTKIVMMFHQAFWNWFDATAWYPLGRTSGATAYPALMMTSGAWSRFLSPVFHSNLTPIAFLGRSAAIWKALQMINIPVNIRDVSVQLAPAFSSLTAFATYLFAKEVGKSGSKESVGLWSALFIGIVPGYAHDLSFLRLCQHASTNFAFLSSRSYISRSVAGSYDNEAIAIFILMITFYFWLRTIREGSILFGGITALSYFYMVAAWGTFCSRSLFIPIIPLSQVLCDLHGSGN